MFEALIPFVSKYIWEGRVRLRQEYQNRGKGTQVLHSKPEITLILRSRAFWPS